MIKDLTKKLLDSIGEDKTRDGLKRTPERVEKSWEFLTKGYNQNIDSIVNGALFEEKYDEMLCIKKIEYFSLCEHHLLPFFGKAHVSYIPNGRIIGLSKIPRIENVEDYKFKKD